MEPGWDLVLASGCADEKGLTGVYGKDVGRTW
jgi:hypothetical protein